GHLAPAAPTRSRRSRPSARRSRTAMGYPSRTCYSCRPAPFRVPRAESWPAEPAAPSTSAAHWVSGTEHALRTRVWPILRLRARSPGQAPVSCRPTWHDGPVTATPYADEPELGPELAGYPVAPPPLPTPVTFDQRWSDLTFIHWPVRPETVAGLYPSGT